MTKIILTISIIFFGCGLMAQQQLENPGMENWEEIGYGPEILEPVNWSAIKSSDNSTLNPLAPVVCERSDDAHSGSYSAKLTCISTLGVVATGTMTNGRLHADMNPDNGYGYTDINDSRWNTPFTGRPDSIVGWYKAQPSVGDFPTVKFILHTGEASIPGNETNYIAKAELNLPATTVSVWTRFSAPFDYLSANQPEYILGIVTSGNGVNAVNGSKAWFDDFELIYNNSSIYQNKINHLDVFQHNNSLIIKIPEGENMMDVFVYSSNGMLIKRSVLGKYTENQININELSSQLLIIKAVSETNLYTAKVLIQK